MSFIASVAHLPDGSSLAYLDSIPAVGTVTYTTILILHGLCFNSYCFEDLFALAPRHNLRLVVVQRKDYRGSSRYTEEEMKLLSNEPTTFLERAGKTTLLFIEHLITNTYVSPLTRDGTRTTGGIQLLGWSLGCIQAMSTFSTSVMLSERISYNLVEPYLKSLILYDPPHSAMGIPLEPIQELYNPFWTDDSLEQQLQNFNTWVTSYFNHSKHWDGKLSKLDGRKFTGSNSIQSWSKDQLQRRIEDFPLRSDGILLMDSSRPSIANMVDDVIFNSNKSTTRAFPHAKIDYISPQHSPWTCRWAAYTIKKKYQSIKEAYGARPMTFKECSRANHALHSDFPEGFLTILRGFEEGFKPESRL